MWSVRLIESVPLRSRAEQQATGLQTAEVEARFTIDPNPPMDLIFAVDQSGSMDNDADALASNFETLVTTLKGVTSAWHIGVLTYDAGCFNSRGLKATTPALSAVFSAAVNAGEDREISDDEALFKILDRGLRQLDARAQYAEDIALATLSNAWQFELSEPAANGSTQVQVDGTTTNSWAFDATSKSVQMNGLQDAGEVVITYSEQGATRLPW
ncbi:MAG: hypothetical protein ACI9VR_001133 [Cognaticolwellia sp.]|jgi:hypothetical protein